MMSHSPLSVHVGDVRAAQSRIYPTCRRTPVLPIDNEEGDTWLKLESLQRTGSFKLRGATNAVARLSADQRAAGVVTYSSGNHGQALACAASRAGVPATIVIPDNAPKFKIDATRRWGAHVVLVPVAERVSACDAIASATGAAIVRPFDDVEIIAGQGTIGLELLDQLPALTTVFAPIGGGGLISGIATAIKGSRPEVSVIGVEPELAADVAASVAAGYPVEWPVARTGRTIADGVRTPRVGELTWPIIERLVDDVVTVSEDEIVDTMRLLAERGHVICEPSGAVAPAAALRLATSKSVVAGVVSGGNIATTDFSALIG
jgi:threonine dehydratase